MIYYKFKTFAHQLDFVKESTTEIEFYVFVLKSCQHKNVLTLQITATHRIYTYKKLYQFSSQVSVCLSPDFSP